LNHANNAIVAFTLYQNVMVGVCKIKMCVSFYFLGFLRSLVFYFIQHFLLN